MRYRSGVLDFGIALGGLIVGFVVGLTGMGGGALMTPLLVLGFGVTPLAAVSSDLVASLVMKPVGGAVHLRHGTVHRGVVKWLLLGSVPSAIVGVVLLRRLVSGPEVEEVLKTAIGVALLLACLGLMIAPRIARLRGSSTAGDAPLQVRRFRTLLVGVFGGLTVGLTSVGSGSLMMVLLLLLYPGLRLKQLVGTDLVQAVPLVAAASLAHLMFGDFRLEVTLSILVGAVPAVFVGARLSSRWPDRWIRPVLIVVLSVSAAKLLDASPAVLCGVGVLALGAVLFTLVIPELRRRRRVPAS